MRLSKVETRAPGHYLLIAFFCFALSVLGSFFAVFLVPLGLVQLIQALISYRRRGGMAVVDRENTDTAAVLTGKGRNKTISILLFAIVIVLGLYPLTLFFQDSDPLLPESANSDIEKRMTTCTGGLVAHVGITGLQSEINNFRAERSGRIFVESPALNAFAQYRSDLLNADPNPKNKGVKYESFWEWVEDSKYSGQAQPFNLAGAGNHYFSSSETSVCDVLNTWTASPSSKVLLGSYQYDYIGLAQSGNTYVYVVAGNN